MRFLRVLKRVLHCRTTYIVGVTLLSVVLISAFFIARNGTERYSELLSRVTYDRTGIPLIVEENEKGLYVYEASTLPEDFKKLLIQKEDRFFLYHLGINPFSTLRALIHYVRNGDAGGASTITQQLAKVLLQTESDRSLRNKCIESIYAVSLEIFVSKEEILRMYANSVFLGNQIQGFETGSYAYFNKPLHETGTREQLALLATLSHPSTRNPWESDNQTFSRALASRLTPEDAYVDVPTTDSYSFQHTSAFELNSAHIGCTETCTTTLDATLTEALRAILKGRILGEYDRGVRSGAIVVIDAHTSELLAMVGSPDPTHDADGGKINMALEPRPIGSTIKPFLYLKGFIDGLRPYSLVDDREYKYEIATGFPLYPKNFDGSYHGEVTLHEALSNSLNVPSIKVLEYIGLNPFYQFMSETLAFEPIQDWNSYQYGIALGGLEMDLLTLTHYFTIFPRYGTIAPLVTIKNKIEQPPLPPQSHITQTKRVADAKFIELVTAIISDRLTGVGQFGLKSNLNLTIPSYAVKTGTSRDFHDSWVIGYTPDFVVGVWIGNTENTALEQVTGQSGAGTIWHDVMEYLAKTNYHDGTQFSQRNIHEIPIENSSEWGLLNDDIEAHRTLLLTDRLITNPHDNDTYARTENMSIPLTAKSVVAWSVNGEFLTNESEARFTPIEVGSYEISAHDTIRNVTEYITIHITNPQ